MITITSSDNVQEGTNVIRIDTDRSKGFYRSFVDADDVIGVIQSYLRDSDKPIRIGVILNTVRQAQNFYHNLDAQNIPAKRLLIHSRFRMHDRLRLEEEVLNNVGKRAVDTIQHTIIVGTQVLEQSLDIDFDVLFTDLAPISLVLQRAGRLHRHDRSNRPQNAQEPVVHVIESPERQYKTHIMIYGEYQLVAAHQYLQSVQDNEKILYNDIPKILATIEEYDEDKIVKLRNLHHLELKEAEKKGSAFRVAEPRRVYTLFDWLSNDKEDDSENLGYARVRDIQSGPAVLLFSRDHNGEPVAGGIGETIPVYSANVYTNSSDVRSILSNNVVLSYRFMDFRMVQALEELANDQDDGVLLNKFQVNGNLDGEIPIILDNKNEVQVENILIKYSPEVGLTEEQVDA